MARKGVRITDGAGRTVDIAGTPSGGGSLVNIRVTSNRALNDAEKIGILREASNLPSGNRTLSGSASRAEATELGEAWVGPGYRVSSDGSTLISADGTRQYRPPSAKPNSPYSQTGVQANFERRIQINGRWQIQANAHPDIHD